MRLLGILLLATCLLNTQDATFSVDVKVVSVLATVRNKQGQVVRTLGKDDFTLEDDGQIQNIRYFAQETDLPLTIGLVVDTSGSQRKVIDLERGASYSFLEQVLREGKDRAFVMHFDLGVELLQDITASRSELENALELVDTPSRRQPASGGTTLYDAVYLASHDLMRKQTGRKALILLTDGVDNSSIETLDSCIAEAQRNDTLVYSILFSDDSFYGGYFLGDGRKVLKRLSSETGASYFEVSKKQPIEAVYKQIEEEMRTQYSLGFTSEKKDGGFHNIRLYSRQKDLMVQTRRGYYAGR